MPSTKYLLQIKEILDTKFNTNLKVASLAEKAGVSESKLAHEFPAAFGLTIQHYLVQARIGKAKVLLEDPERSLKQIAYSIGYKNPESFTRVFKRVMGQTPHQYRSAL